MIATFRVRAGARILGLSVLVLCLAGAVLVAGEAGAWTWLLLGVVAAAALAACVANFGDRLDADEEGLSRDNVLLARLGWTRSARKAPWSAIRHAVDQDGDTLFLDVEGQGRWVLDQLDGHAELRILLAERGVPVAERARPRLVSWRRHR